MDGKTDQEGDPVLIGLRGGRTASGQLRG